MKIDLSGKTALVTGSTAGIGYAIAKGLAAAGSAVVLNGRGKARVDEAAARLAKEVAGGKVRGIAADVSTAAGCKELVAALPEVEILINNAGIFEPKNFFEIPDEDWSRFFEVNVMSGVRLSISRGLAKLTRGTGVTVNAVLPGPTMSEGVEGFVKDLAKQNGQSEAEAAGQFVKQHRPSSLLQRFASVNEIANMVVYVSSKEASATNGAALRAEGGIVDTIA